MGRAHVRFLAASAALGAALLACQPHAFAVEMKELAVEAIAKGKAQGEVTGKIAQNFARTTGSSEPVHAWIAVEKRFARKDCARLQIVVAQRNVPRKDGTSKPFALPFSMNLCADGTAPPDGVDLGANPLQLSASRK